MAVYTAINDAGSFFNTVIYTGTGGVQTISGVGFQPDFTWIKDRDVANWHSIVDTVRGYSKWVYSNSTTAEATVTDRLTSWNSDGFVLGAGVETNTSSSGLVAWNWKAGTTSGLSGGDITPSAYSFNTTSGFSVLQYTGNDTADQTIPHGLGAVPTLIMLRKLSDTASWVVYHQATGNTKRNFLNTTAVPGVDADTWEDTTPTSTIFTVGRNSFVNTSGATYLAYVFCDVKGYSKMGSYTGNGNADGAFGYTGFRPAFIIFKRTDGTGDWLMFDRTRSPANVTKKTLEANDSAVEGNISDIDMLSNGFKLRYTDTDTNASGGDYIYIAFAESPFVNAEGVPTNAR